MARVVMLMRHVRIRIPALLLLLVLLAGCGGKKAEEASGKITVVFWHSFVSETVPALNDLIAKFEAEHPGITVKAQYVPTGDALLQKLITAVQSSTAPDISWIHSNFMEPLVDAGAIYRMDEFINGENGIPPAEMLDIYPALLQQASFRGVLYSLPMEATNVGLVYNRELFRNVGLDPDRPPQTWDELYAFSRKLTVDRDHDGRNDQIGFYLPIFPASGPMGDYMVWLWYPFLWQAGGVEINDAQSAVLTNSPAGVRALALWQRLYVDLDLKKSIADYDAAFAGRQLAMVMDGPWNLPRYRRQSKLDWAVAPLPAGPVKRATVVGGEYLVILRQSQHPKEAWTFLKWILKPENQALWSMKSGYLPVRRSVMQVPEYQKFLSEPNGLRAFVEQMEFGQATKPMDHYSLQVSRNLAEALERATVGGIDPKAALDEGAGKSNTLLQSVTKR